MLKVNKKSSFFLKWLFSEIVPLLETYYCINLTLNLYYVLFGMIHLTRLNPYKTYVFENRKTIITIIFVLLSSK